MAGISGWLAAGMLAAAAAPPPAIPPAGDAETTATMVGLRAADDRMTVEVMIDGAGPFRFIVDSGATRTVISRELARLLRLPDAGAVEMSSVGGASTVPSVAIARLSLGDLPARAIVAPVLAADDLGAAGILGIDALVGATVTIDLASRRMTILRSRRVQPVETGEIVVVARRRYGQLVLADADAAGQRIWAIVDTGSMVSIGNGPLRDRLVRKRRAAPVETVITDVAGNRITAAMSTIGDMRLGTWHLRDTAIAFFDAYAFERFGLADRPSMLLGMDIIGAFDRVSIDFPRRTVRLLHRHDPGA